MAKNKVLSCGITIIMCGVMGFLINLMIPIQSSYVYFYLLGPITIIFGIIITIIGAISGTNPEEGKE